MLGSLGDRIRKARRSRNLTQSQLAELLRVSRSAVANWESPTGSSPCIDNLFAIAIAAEVSWHWLATGKDANDDTGHLKDHTERLLLDAFRSSGADTRHRVLQLLETESCQV